MIKLEIKPSFINSCLFELKNKDSNWELIFIKDANKFLNDKGGIWKLKKVDFSIAEKIILLSSQIINKKEEKILGLDGVSSKLMFKNESIKFWCPKKNSKELELVSLFLKLMENFKDANCINYMELLSQYFFDIIPIKEFNEEVFRLKVFGGLTNRDFDILLKKIKNLKTKKFAILDMSNFLSTGSILNKCFIELKDNKNIKILVNKASFNYLTSIGFNKIQMEKL